MTTALCPFQSSFLPHVRRLIQLLQNLPWKPSVLYGSPRKAHPAVHMSTFVGQAPRQDFLLDLRLGLSRSLSHMPLQQPRRQGSILWPRNRTGSSRASGISRRLARNLADVPDISPSGSTRDNGFAPSTSPRLTCSTTDWLLPTG